MINYPEGYSKPEISYEVYTLSKGIEVIHGDYSEVVNEMVRRGFKEVYSISEVKESNHFYMY